MKVAIFGTTIQKEFVPLLKKLFLHLTDRDVEISLFKPFCDFLTSELKYKPPCHRYFTSHTDFDGNNQFIFSIGGDGTFLNSFLTIRNFNIPVIGVNSGRLGFLADISKEYIIDALKEIFNGNYTVTERSLLEVNLHGAPNMEFNYALNEMTILRSDSSSMIIIHAWVNGEYLNSFWADGIIIATPTGSTAYSLSVGGPILTPDSKNFVITPVAPHNLAVRPLVVPDNSELLLKVEGRGTHFLTSLDSRSANVELSTTITVRKADFMLKTLHLPSQTFYQILRTKMMWGMDKRN